MKSEIDLGRPIDHDAAACTCVLSAPCAACACEGCGKAAPLFERGDWYFCEACVRESVSYAAANYRKHAS